jgi:hypothetical protein
VIEGQVVPFSDRVLPETAPRNTGKRAEIFIFATPAAEKNKSTARQLLFNSLSCTYRLHAGHVATTPAERKRLSPKEPHPESISMHTFPRIVQPSNQILDAQRRAERQGQDGTAKLDAI